jgi:hypothetical protein
MVQLELETPCPGLHRPPRCRARRFTPGPLRHRIPPGRQRPSPTGLVRGEASALDDTRLFGITTDQDFFVRRR